MEDKVLAGSEINNQPAEKTQPQTTTNNASETTQSSTAQEEVSPPIAIAGGTSIEIEEDAQESVSVDTSSFVTSGSTSTAQSDELVSCANQMAVDGSSIVDIGSNTTATLTPNSVLVVAISGNVGIKLDGIALNAIRGLCIFMRGTSAINITTDIGLSKLFYDGGGSSNGIFQFGELVNSANITIGGSSSISLSGSINCPSVVKTQSGSSTYSCQ